MIEYIKVINLKDGKKYKWVDTVSCGFGLFAVLIGENGIVTRELISEIEVEDDT